MKYQIIIPARKGSKGLPFKNRILIENTINSIPKSMLDNVVIATDDEFIMKKYSNFKILERDPSNCLDNSSIKSVMEEVVRKSEFEKFIILYTTYPERKDTDILKVINFFEKTGAKSLLCKKEVKTSPYLMMFEEGNKGSQIICHDLYRRQDYLKCFEISHFVCIFSKKELDNLNNNMYNKDTVFFKIENPIDVDTYEDLEKYNEKNKNNC